MNYMIMPGLVKRPRLKPNSLKFFSVKRIINAVERHFNMTYEDLVFRSQHRYFVYPRQICLYLLAKHTPLNRTGVGLVLKRDHYATLDAIKKINDFIDTDERVVEEIREITENI